jgi:hypothetical protein
MVLNWIRVPAVLVLALGVFVGCNRPNNGGAEAARAEAESLKSELAKARAEADAAKAELAKFREAGGKPPPRAPGPGGVPGEAGKPRPGIVRGADGKTRAFEFLHGFVPVTTKQDPNHLIFMVGNRTTLVPITDLATIETGQVDGPTQRAQVILKGKDGKEQSLNDIDVSYPVHVKWKGDLGIGQPRWKDFFEKSTIIFDK